MKRLMQMGALCAATCLVAPAAWGAGFQNTGQSATATSMGSMGTANPDEPNSSFYNPSVMSFNEGFQIYLGTTIIVPTTTYRNDQGDTDQTVAQTFPPPNFHVAYGTKFGLAFGLGLTLPYGLGVEWDEDWDGRAAIVKQDLQNFNLNPNVSYKLPNLDLSFAVGAQVVYSTVELNRKIILRNDTEVATQIGGDGLGFGATASLMYKPIEDVSIGLNYRSGMNVNYEGSAHFEGEEGTPFESSFVDQDISTQITLPHHVTLGLGYKLDKLFVGLDIGYTTWSDYDQIDLKFSRPCPQGSPTCDPTTDQSDPPTTSIVSNWNNAFAFRLGLQYEVIDNLNARVGIAYDMTPIPDETVSPSLPGNDRTVFSLGLGYTMAKVRADIGYQYVDAAEREIGGVNPNLPGLYKTTAHVLGLNIGYGYD